MSTSNRAPEIARMMNPPRTGESLFERIAAPRVARMVRDRVPDELPWSYTESALAQSVAYTRLAKHFADRGLHGLAGFYRDRARELER